MYIYIWRGREANTDRFSLGTIQIISYTLRGAGGSTKLHTDFFPFQNTGFWK